MKASTRVGGFALGLVAVAGAAALVGTAVGPVGAEPEPHMSDDHGRDEAAHGSTDSHGGGDSRDAGSTAGPELPGGLMVSQDGYTLRLLRDRFEPTERVSLRFQITDATGAPVTRYETSHGKDLHLIAVRRDLTDFQHVHPVLAADGTWSVPLDLSDAGEYRVFTDFVPAGAESGYTLGHDLSVSGGYEPQPLPAPTDRTAVAGYEVAVDGTLVAGETARITLTVTRDGVPVTDLEPYLEAYGHLVALRDGDLAYLHVHPDGEPGDGSTEPGPQITFYAEVPSAGSYRLFLDFKHEGQVRTAAFTAVATEQPGSTPEGASQPEGDDHGGSGPGDDHGGDGHGGDGHDD